jgi:uncharacterized protein YndB with AHSA1/START domain
MATHTQDRIERRIDIDADAERVWELISRPGWWINDGAIIDHTVERAADDVSIIHHETYGDFRIGTVTLDAPRYAAFRWLGGENDAATSPDGGSTLVEFWVEDRTGGVSLRVVESGFASLNVSDEARRKNIDENTDGWEQELAAAKTWIGQHSVGQHSAGQHSAGQQQ